MLAIVLGVWVKMQFPYVRKKECFLEHPDGVGLFWQEQAGEMTGL